MKYSLHCYVLFICATLLMHGAEGLQKDGSKKVSKEKLNKGKSSKSENHQKIFMATIPKSGTHLISKLMKGLTKRSVVRILKPDPQKIAGGWFPDTPKNEIIRSHLGYDAGVASRLKRDKFRCLFMVRDPRDQVVSMAYWIVTRANAHPEEAAAYKEDHAYFDKVLLRRILGIKKCYDRFMPWMDNPLFYTVRFENLVGSEGGGSDAAQLDEIKEIVKHLNVPISNQEIKKCAKNLFGGTSTFRKGQIGGWKKHFKKEHIKVFKEVAGQLLIDLGYENDLNW
jgi:sulfotransferase 6B1